MADTKQKKNKFDGLTLAEARRELQVLSLRVKTGEEQDVTKIKKLKKYIARILTQQNNAS